MTLKINPVLACFIVAFTITGHTLAGPLEDGQTAQLHGDYPHALADFVPLAKAGDAKAQYELGGMYERGTGVIKDYAQAASWYQRAAIQGEDRAQLMLALLYASGRGVPQDDGKGRYWLGKVSENAAPDKKRALLALYAMNRTGYDHGQPLTMSEITKRALPHLQSLADHGNINAQCTLVQLYDTGQAAPESKNVSDDWRKRCVSERQALGRQPPPPGIYLPPSK